MRNTLSGSKTVSTTALSSRAVLRSEPKGFSMTTRRHAPSFSSVVQTATAAVVLLALVLVGLDPLVGVFGSMAGVSTVGMVLLMTVTSVAVLTYFGRHPEAARGRVVPTKVAPVVAILGLLACAWLVVSNFTLVTGGSAAVSTVLALIPPAAFVLGVVLGGRYSLLEDTVVGPAEG